MMTAMVSCVKVQKDDNDDSKKTISVTTTISASKTSLIFLRSFQWQSNQYVTNFKQQ